jgi:Fic family protein
MDINKRVGIYLKCSAAGETYNTYLPKPLPPDPPLMMEKIYPLLDKANVAIGRLDGISHVLPDQNLFLYFYVRKEAVLSSQIEGTQSSLSDLLLYENAQTPGVPEQDVIEVSNYVAAMNLGLQRLRKDGFPLSLRLIREIHAVLLNHGRGSNKQPGEFRRSQNWLGGTRPGNAKFVPPPPEKLMGLLGDFENFLHNKKKPLPTLIKAAFMHVQFETIHPFLDGNGRLGRLLITFLLCVEGLLDKPLLYLSLYFKEHRQEYYDYLQLVRTTGDWESWIQFFLEGIVVTAEQAVETARKIMQLFEENHKKITSLGRSVPSTVLVHHDLQRHPLSAITKIAERCKTTAPTVTKALQHLIELGVVQEITGKERHRIYVYQKYLNILNAGIGGVRNMSME